jgi:hydrogenase expression/formation protein HypE
MKSDNLSTNFGHKNILLAHGGGGKLMHQLLEDVFFPVFGSIPSKNGLDGAVIEQQNSRLAFTTDSYVVDPLFFPGGNIGSMAVHGTINDLAMCGARPLFLSVGFIIEEGFSVEILKEIVLSIQRAATEAGVQIITGDTKVVDKGKGSGIYINTSGLGILEHNLNISPSNICPEDSIIINEDIGRHGIAVMSERGKFDFKTNIKSDCTHLASTVMNLLKSGINIHCLHDLTRGGLASALVEIAQISKKLLKINEDSIPVHDSVHSACEILGLDPIYVANEGGFVIFVPPDEADKTLKILHTDNRWKNAAVIGKVSDKQEGLVTIRNILGVERIMDMLTGEQLPRIC